MVAVFLDNCDHLARERSLAAMVGDSAENPVPVQEIIDLPAGHLLANVGTVTSHRSGRTFCFSPEAVALAWEAMTR